MKKFIAKLIELFKFLYEFLFSKTSEKVEIPEEEYQEPPVEEPDPDEIEEEVSPEIRPDDSITADPPVVEEDYDTIPEEDPKEEIVEPEVPELEEPIVETPEEPKEEVVSYGEFLDKHIETDPHIKECLDDGSISVDTMIELLTPAVDDTAMSEGDMFFFFVNEGMNYYGAAGLMGNLYAESGLRSNNLQNTYSKKFNMSDEEYTSSVDAGIYHNFVGDSAGYGLAQWTFWTRKQNLLDFAVSTERSIGNCKMQLEFLMKELKESYKSVYTTLCNATSVLEASNAVLLKFERPADQSESVQNKRASFGQKYYDKYVGV